MRRVILITLVSLIPALSLAWGPKGHDIVAYIAEQHLSHRAQERIEAVLDGCSMVYVANWLDNASHTPEYAHTKTWHYCNVDPEEQSYANSQKEDAGDVVTAINSIVERLKSGELSIDEERVELMMLIHLVGDMHCPMHAGRLSDLGGNLVTVKWFGREVKLHAVWDDLIVESVRKWSYSEWQREIDNVSRKEREALSAGTPLDWMNETVAICQQVYKDAPAGSELSWDYQNDHYPLLESQLRKAGYRLARLLNEIYK